MGLLEFLLSAVGHGLILLIDIVVLLVMVRLLCQRWRQPHLVAFEAAGRPIVDGVIAQVDQWCSRCGLHVALNERQPCALAIAILLLARAILRLALTVFLHLSTEPRP
jgi:hypothetical protein